MDIGAFKTWASEVLTQAQYSEQDKTDILENSNSIFEMADRTKADGSDGADGVLSNSEIKNAKGLFYQCLAFVELFSPKEEKTEEKSKNNIEGEMKNINEIINDNNIKADIDDLNNVKGPFDKLTGYNVHLHPVDINQATILVNGESVGVLKNKDGSFTIMRGNAGCPANKIEMQTYPTLEELTQALENKDLEFGKYSGFNINDYEY